MTAAQKLRDYARSCPAYEDGGPGIEDALHAGADALDALAALQSPPPREADALWPLVEEWQTARRDLRAAERDEHGVEAAETRYQDSARALEAYRPPSPPPPETQP